MLFKNNKKKLFDTTNKKQMTKVTRVKGLVICCEREKVHVIDLKYQSSSPAMF